MTKHLQLILLTLVILGPLLKAEGQIITTVAGNGIKGVSGDGRAATAARISSPSAIAVDGAGNLYINDRFCVRKVTKAGMISSIAGTGALGSYGDGVPATTAQLNGNWGIAADSAGNVYIADQSNFKIRKVSTSGIITTVAGTGTGGYNGDNMPAIGAQINGPLGVAVDFRGNNVYIGDVNNFRIRKVDAGHFITTIGGIGNRGYSGDGGPATLARIGYCWGIAVDSPGNVYVCDGEYHCVRKINTAGIISTIAGRGTPGFGGDNGPAVQAFLNFPTGVTVDRAGNVYISDCYNNRLRKIDNAGIITTVAGTGTAGFAGDGGPATGAYMHHPASVAIDRSNNIFISDFDNSRIRWIRKVLSFDNGNSQSISICENTAAASVNNLLTASDYTPGGAMDTWSLIYGPFYGSVAVSYSAHATGGPVTPSGLFYTPVTGFVGTDTFKVIVSNGVASDTTTITVTVSPSALSAGTIVGETEVCPGATITLTNATIGGVWSSANTSAIVVPFIGGCTVIGDHPGTNVIKYTLSNSCGSATATKTITIRDLPNTGTITGKSKMCLGSTITLSASLAGGTWSSSLMRVSVIDGVVKALKAGRDTIRYTATNAYCTAFAEHNITVETFPNAGTITGPSRLCIGKTATYGGVTAGGIWGLSNNATASIDEGKVSGLSAGTSRISYSVSNTCGTAIEVLPIDINPSPEPPVISQFAFVLSVPPDFSAYKWTRNEIGIPGSDTNTCIVSNPGVYAVTVTNSYGCLATSPSLLCGDCTPDDIRIFPNPTTAVVNVNWCKKMTVRLMCMDGREIEVNGNAGAIDMSNLPNGLYLLTIHDAKGNMIKTKLITKLTN